MTEWYYADGQDRQGPFLVEELRQRFQRGEISLTTLVWREGYPQWKPVSEAVEELQLQKLTSATENLGSGFDLRGDYTAIDNGTAPLPGTGGGTYSPYTASTAAGSYGSAVVGGGEVVYAGFWKRYAAYFLDSIVVAIINVPVSLVFNLIGAASGNESLAVALSLVAMLGSLIIGIGYYAGFHASRGGATLGKMAVGIKVVRSNGERITFLRGVGRYFGFILSSLTLLIGFIMAAFTERKQALHDMLCDTLVVDKWAFTENAQFQEHGLGTVTIVILVISGILTVAMIGLAIAMFGVIAASMS
ncbi:RDD family protein [Stenotrophomonas sp. ISL-67]|uniref:RDD family protein n=1 Tax=Stenotrophomonas sp. ISL-67 TaxID=2819171 RepID=UPI001BE5D664|nr:RDD family protein [Stenotrophomonas sp. ISL-67]MBT2767763.1 RDD family protein [Stenotrophomonas sp. ISL-67]